MTIARRFIVKGSVQGVGYRFFAIRAAQRLGVVGRVQNLPDGSVEAIAEGSRGKIEQLIAWCQCGPPGARVTNVDVRWETPEHAFRGFAITR